MCAAFYYSGGGDDNILQPVVLDIGSYSTKMGWAGDDYPKSYFRSNVAVCRQNQNQQSKNEKDNNNAMDTSMASSDDDAGSSHNRQRLGTTGSSGRILGGKNMIKYDYYTNPINYMDGTDGNYEPCNPINSPTGLLYQSINSNSIINTTTSTKNNNNNNTNAEGNDHQHVDDWYDLLQYFVHHSYDTALRGNNVHDHPMILSERAYNIPPIRQKITECIFEELNIPAFFLAKDVVLQCYAVGRTSAISVDIGYSGITVAPVYDGYVENKGIKRCPIGLKEIDEFILSQMDHVYYNTKYNNNKKSKQSNISNTIMPLYQVRSKTKAKRKDSIHHAARLFLAQQCRESGAGIAIDTTQEITNHPTAALSVGTNKTSTTGQQQQQQSSSSSTAAASGITTTSPTFHAPSQPFDLPDGTVIDIPSSVRFRAADYLFGINGNTVIPMIGGGGGSNHNNNTYSSNNKYVTLQQRRDEIYEQTKNKILSYCSTTATAVASFHVNRSNGNNNNTVEDTRNNDAYFAQQAAAAALGIVPRKQQHHYYNKNGNIDKNINNSNARNEAYINWHRACMGDLHTLANEQLTCTSIADMICDAVYKCDRDQQAALLGNVVVGGGGAACLGPTENAVPDFIKDTVESIIHTHTPGWRVKVYTPNVPSERAVLPWLGGSILGSLNTFHNMWITKAEYDEWGSAIVNRKCP